MITLRKALFSTGSGGKGSTNHAWVKTIHPITKLAHMRLDLGKVLTANNMPLLRQNAKNRKANYANPDRVLTLFNEYR